MILPVMLLALLGIGLAKAQQYLKGADKKTEYPPVPSIVDPSVWSAGQTASRRTKGSSGAPQGGLWQSAAKFSTQMPGLIGR